MTRHRFSRPALILAVAAGALAAASTTGAPAASGGGLAGAHQVRLELRVETRTQAELLASDRIEVHLQVVTNQPGGRAPGPGIDPAGSPCT